MLKIAICEALPAHQKNLEDNLAQFLVIPYEVQKFSLIAEFNDIFEKSVPDFDIIFMDIQFPDGSGIELVQEINVLCPMTQIIYVTSYLDQASEVYTTKHVWFIDKQHINEYLPLALNKAFKALNLLHHSLLTFSWKGVKYSIPQKSIIYIERRLRVSEIHTDEQTYRSSDKLSEILARLNDSFAICHQSYIINMLFITDFDKKDVILKHQHYIPISRSKHNEFIAKYNLFHPQ